jgi:non-ribosomal peptide synthetase component F
VLTQVSGRDSRFYGKLDVTGLMGNFTNMLMVRNTIDHAQSLVDFLQNAQHNFLEDLHHDAYPADKLLEELPGINQPDFLSSTVLFNYHNYSYFKDKSYITGEKEEETSVRGGVPLQPALVLAVSEYDKCLELMFAFNKGEWKPAFPKQVRATFFAILDQAMQQPQLTIAALGAPAAKKSSALN